MLVIPVVVYVLGTASTKLCSSKLFEAILILDRISELVAELLAHFLQPPMARA